MQIIQTSNSSAAVQALSQRLNQELSAGKRVSWFVSGGSNIGMAAAIMSDISQELSHNLTVSLVDERYGAVGHADSNFQQLLDAGFDAKAATLVPVLTGKSLNDTAEAFLAFVDQTLKNSDYSVALLGIGTDGHIAGILPHSPAIEDPALVAAYISQPYERITTTFSALKKLSSTYTFAYGEAKKLPLDNLAAEALSLTDQPSQILHEMTDAFVYTDQIIGETA